MLEQHVLGIQKSVRSCEGCGLCCTEAYNSVQILPVEALRIVRHLDGLPPDRKRELVHRLRVATARHGLRDGGPKKTYTCGFLEKDMRCALPLHVKPVACLAFNPVDRDRCEMDEPRYFGAHAAVEDANAAAHFPDQKRSIPAAVLIALGETLPAGVAPRDPPRPPPSRRKKKPGRRFWPW